MASIIKKCDHTPAQRRTCRHSWVVRYRANGVKRERSFPWTNKEVAKTFALDIESRKRQGDYVDPKQASVKFADVSAAWIKNRRAESSRDTYANMANTHVNPAIGNMTLATLASPRGRDAVEELLTQTLPANLSVNSIKLAYQLITGTVNDAVKKGKVSKHHLSGISITGIEPVREISDFVFPSFNQLEQMSEKMPSEYRLTVWLMRGCGLRIGEALGVTETDFRDGILRVHRQLNRNGSYGPVKARKAGEYRDVPVPSYVTRMLAEQAVQENGHLFAVVNHRTFTNWFTKARDMTGIPSGFTPHSLRHVFASVALARGVPITDVSKWLGHRDINMTYGIYGHLVPSSFDRARNVLDAEYQEWSEQ